MSDDNRIDQLKRDINVQARMTVIVLLLMVAVVILALFLWERSLDDIDDVADRRDASTEELVEEARDLLEQADGQIAQYLTFLQTATAVLGLVGVALTVLGLNNQRELQQLRSRTASQLEELEELRREIGPWQAERRAYSQVQFAIRQIEQDNLRSALRIFLSIGDDIPDDPIVNYYIGDLYVRLARFREAKQILKQALESPRVGPDVQLSIKASYAYTLRVLADERPDPQGRERDYQQSEQLFLDIWDQDPDLLDVQGESVFGALGGLYRRWGERDLEAINAARIDQAIATYEHAASVTPYSTYPRINLAVLYLVYASNEDVKRARKQDADALFADVYRKAQRNISVNPNSYYHCFDAISALAGLGDRAGEVLRDNEDRIAQIRDYIRVAGELRPVTKDRDKLLGTLADIARADPPPLDMAEIIKMVRDDLDVV